MKAQVCLCLLLSVRDKKSNNKKVQSGTIISWHIKLTKVSGGIAGGIVLLLLITCCIWGKAKRNKEARKRSGMGRRNRPSGVVYTGPQNYFNWNRTPQEDGVVLHQDHELGPMPERAPDIQGDGAPPAYQVFQQGPQREGYEAL